MFEIALLVSVLFLNISYLYLSFQFLKLQSDVRQCLAGLDAFVTVVGSEVSGDG